MSEFKVTVEHSTEEYVQVISSWGVRYRFFLDGSIHVEQDFAPHTYWTKHSDTIAAVLSTYEQTNDKLCKEILDVYLKWKDSIVNKHPVELY